ncbi:MAG: hypothetical protein ACK4UN_15470 [Limisphaerales bacterium]
MNALFRFPRYFLILFALLAAALGHGAELPVPTTPANRSEQETTLHMGGVGGVYFFAQPGELVIEVEKRDRNRKAIRTELRAILTGPDRRVIEEQIIPEDGKPVGSGWGPVQKCRFVTQVEHAGVYVLNVTISRDRYGIEAAWGFRSNCKQYLIETARGHRDQPHEEPIVFISPERSANINFLPRQGAFSVEISGLPRGTGPAKMFDGDGAELAVLETSGTRVTYEFPASMNRKAVPWRLHLPSAEAVVHIDGLTRWNANDAYLNMACWTPDRNSWFPFLENRWMLTPYHLTIYGKAGERKELTFQVHNNSATTRTFDLAVEFPGEKWNVNLDKQRVQVLPKSVTNLTVQLDIPPRNVQREAHLRVAPTEEPAYTTYSSLIARSGAPPATKSSSDSQARRFPSRG